MTDLASALAAYKNSLEADFVRLTLDLPLEEHARLKSFAKSSGVTMSALLRIVVSLALDEAAQKPAEPQQAEA